MNVTRTLPSHFRLEDLTAVTGTVFELRTNPFRAEANQASEKWFKSIGAYEGKKLDRFLSHRFDLFAYLTFPDADQEHLEVCIDFFFWAFSFDDLSDEGELQRKPEEHGIGVNICLNIFTDPMSNTTGFPYAKMLKHIWRQLNEKATPGTCARFARAAKNWCNSQIQQATNRKLDRMPTVEEFIPMRRHTIGGAMVEAMVEYSININLPDYVFEDPIIVAMSDATTDIMTWPNDICSFNKEQADGDCQNLVYCVMVEQDVDLQAAMNIVTNMVRERVAEYAALKKRLRSFGEEVDAELNRYIKGVEYFVQGTVCWYYSPRYFRDIDLSDKHNLIVPVFTSSC